MRSSYPIVSILLRRVGADTLALALLELNLSVLHIAAVRCPPNTIDR